MMRWDLRATPVHRGVGAKMFALAGLLFLVVAFIVWTSKDTLPGRNAIDPRIARGAPVQVVYEGSPRIITEEYGEFIYRITPRASYRIPGVVVSLHHSDSFTDISHEFDPWNTMDICVVWGPNITTGGYTMVTYDHGDFTCYYRWSGENDPPFSGNFLANNHMIPANPLVADQIRSLSVGDQIIIEGDLVDYSVSGKEGEKYGHRNTSMTREDSGNGACEIIYASSVTILERNHPLASPIAFMLFLLGATLIVFSLWMAMYWDHRPRPLAPPNEYNDPRDPLNPANYIPKETLPPDDK